MDKRTVKIIGMFLPLFLIMMLSGCSKENNEPIVYKENGDSVIKNAVAEVHPLNNSGVNGIVYFNKVKGGIEIIADIDGLTNGKHGFHIHEFGDLRKGDGSSAGGHFNPYDMPHGAPDMAKRHVGDLGNIVALNKETAHYKYVDTMITFTGVNSIIGRSVIIHEGEDDLTSQPSGNAGARIAGGVIGIANDQF